MKPTQIPNNPCFSSGPCAKRPGWSLDALKDATLGRSHRAKIGKDKLAERHPAQQKDSRHSRCVPARHRSRLRHRRGRNGAVVAPRRTRRRRPGVGEFQQRLGRRLQKPAPVEGPSRLQGRLRQASRSSSGGLVARCRLRLEWNYLRRPDSKRLLDRRGPAWTYNLRRHVSRLCHGDAVGQARRGHMVLAKSAGRRRRARNDRAQSHGRCSAWKPSLRIVLCRRSFK